jgi:hypothetical protein
MSETSLLPATHLISPQKLTIIHFLPSKQNMSEAIPLNAAVPVQYSNPSNPSLGPSAAYPYAAAAPGPLPVLSNARVAGRCRVVDCLVDLNTQTNTNRKYYLCRDHWAADAVMVDGTPQRFCGQCSRFKVLTEYDGPKRTCRQCLFLRNTKKRNQRYESLQRGPYNTSSSSLPPYQLNNGRYVPGAAVAGQQQGASHPSQSTGYYNNTNTTATVSQMAMLQQQLLQLQQIHQQQHQQPPAPGLPAQQHSLSTGIDVATIPNIDVDSLETVLSLINSVGILGDGHTGNAEADALFYLFQELQTLKQEVETKGVTVASMHAKRRKLAAEQELARANLEVAEIEEQLIKVASLNKQQQQQQKEEQQQQQQQQQAVTANFSNPNGSIDEFLNVITQSMYTTTAVITSAPADDTATGPATATPSPNISGGLLQKDGHLISEGPSSIALPLPPAPETTDAPNLARQASSG